jgi:hypothetical protein
MDDIDPDDFIFGISESEQALYDVEDALEKASVDPHGRKILWPDGASLSIEQTAARIAEKSDAPLERIQSHVVGWLLMIYEPQGLDEHQMEEFERLIDRWTKPYV